MSVANNINKQKSWQDLKENRMKSKGWKILAGLCALATAGAWAAPVQAQTAEVKEKPPMYTYVSNWTLPRAKWAEMEKGNATTDKILDKAIAGGDLVAYGNDENLVHQADGDTHDGYWSAMSMAGVLNVLDAFYKSGTTASPILSSATKHSDNIYVSRFYNWHAGVWHGAYTHGASYKLKPDAPNDAIETLSKSFIVPMLEKLLADGTINEYEIDEEAIHTEAPGTFWVFYITASADGLDKVNAALGGSLKSNPLIGPAIDSMVDFTPHRDSLARTNATYK
jgi:hypothetical protein